MQLSEDDKRVLIALIWCLKPSDQSVLQAVLEEPTRSQIATTKFSGNGMFYSNLERFGLAELKENEPSVPGMRFLKTVNVFMTATLTEQGKAELAPLLHLALTTGVPPENAIISAEVIKLLNQYAGEGNAPAQTKLAILYDQGKGVEQSYSEALEWYLKAAQQNDTTACNNIGVMCFAGFGVQRDLEIARQWFVKAADLGSPGAMDNLGEMYARGLGVPQDNAEALKWFRKAAENGHAEAARKAAALSQQ
ncbi:MAG: tetratricopeptide repeat protein [Candidatus Binataceae bacterium]